MRIGIIKTFGYSHKQLTTDWADLFV
jgi:hypothetical protein